MHKRIFLTASLFLISLTANTQQVVENTTERLSIHYSTPRLETIEGDGFFLYDLPGYHQSGAVGTPSLPVLGSLLSVPFCDGMDIVVTNAVYDTISLTAVQLRPMQPSRFKSDTSAVTWFYDEKTYTSDHFHQLPLASVEHLGIARDRNLALISFSPISYNPVSNKAVVCRSADITIRFRNADAARTAEYYNRYHTPAFSVGPTLNDLAITKGVTTSTPLRMVILAGPTLECYALQQFADWKRSQGMIVDLIYASSGQSATTLANQLKQMYTDATDDAPAPTYLLLVGDRGQMPAHATKLSGGWSYGYDSYDHITDLYYTTWTDGDYLPDCYWGRFSATDTTTLRSIIDKTLYYERYLFAHDDYLTRAALIAGVDHNYNFGYSHADPAMDYVAYHYLNSDNGIYTLSYYKNNTSSAPDGVTVTGSSQSSNAATQLRSIYNTGAGWINYSAHGDWNCWAEPSFTVTNVNTMSNFDMPSFMIGNCCLTNKFDKATCLGEALLRRADRAGAVIYIGGTNSTIWDEDFYWAVGVRGSISATMSLQYNASNMGIYDRLFHTHGEDLSDYAITAGKIVMQGNMAVNSSSSSNKQYYWEIYEIMGDPSLMPWLGKAKVLQASAIQLNTSSLSVSAVAGAYVALVTTATHDVLSAVFAGTNGLAILPIPEGAQLSDCSVAITAQGYKPFFKACTSSFVGIGSPLATQPSIYPNPATSRCTVEADGLQRIFLLDLKGQQLLAASATDNRCTLHLGSLSAGIYLLRAETATGISFQKLIVE